jgi:peroxiredoxin
VGISVDSPESHRKFIEKHKLLNITLLSDTDKSVIKKYNTKHWLLPVSKRVYIIVDSTGTIIYRNDTGFSLLENQTATLIIEIDKKIR